MVDDTNTANNAPEAEQGGLLSSAWNMGAAAWNYASQTVSRYVLYTYGFIYMYMYSQYGMMV
jgi:hypothetical protein